MVYFDERTKNSDEWHPYFDERLAKRACYSVSLVHV